MKIIAHIPVWRRPEVTKITVNYIPDWVTPIYILSREDPEYEENYVHITNKGFEVFEYKNNPLGEKHNAGIIHAMQYEFDYLMNINSDDILNTKLIDLYKEDIENQTPFFGINDLYIFDKVSGRMVLLPDYNDSMCMGAGRMIHRTVLEKLNGKIYTPELANGLDTNSRKNIENAGFKEKCLKTDLTPYALDIKTWCNINTMVSIEGCIWHEIIDKDINYVTDELRITTGDKEFFQA